MAIAELGSIDIGKIESAVGARIDHRACADQSHYGQRGRIVRAAHGTVVEIGMGAGVNLPIYNPQRVAKLIGIEPNKSLANVCRGRLGRVAFDAEIVEDSIDRLSLDDDLADTVVMTYRLCSWRHVAEALAEIRRVLKPDGQLLFCEHGRAERQSTAGWQDRINPLWSRVTSGCNLNRPVSAMIEAAGFRIDALETSTLPAVPAIIGFHYVGVARLN